TVGVTIEKALFTKAQSVAIKKSDPVIINQLITFLDGAPKGSKVYLSVYYMIHKQLIDAIKKAYKRGVEMHLMLDSSKVSSIKNNGELFYEFQDLFQKPSEIIGINNDIESYTINHEK